MRPPITLINNSSHFSFFYFWVILPSIASCTRTYQPNKITPIVNSVNIPFFLLLMQQSSWIFRGLTMFLDTSWPTVVKWALYEHHFSARPTNTFQRHTLQHLLQFTHTSPTYTQTYSQNSLLTMTYPHPFNHMNILRISPIITELQITSLYLSYG